MSIQVFLWKKICPLVNDTDNEGVYASVETDVIWKISFLPLNFVVNLKLLKKIVLNKKIYTIKIVRLLEF